MPTQKNQRGFTAIESAFAVLAVIAIGAAVYYAILAHSDNSNSKVATTASPTPSSSPSPSASPSGASSGNMLAISQWSVKMTLPSTLTGLTYTIDGTGSTATVYSNQLKGQPSTCTGQTTTDGTLGYVVRDSTAFKGSNGSTDPDQRHVGSYYYQVGQPNGSSCQKSSDMQKLESDQTALLKQAFQTLQ